MIVRRVVGLLGVLGLSACAEGALRERLEREWSCGAVEIEALGSSAYRAHGCGRRGVYVCSPGMGGIADPACVREASR